MRLFKLLRARYDKAMEEAVQRAYERAIRQVSWQALDNADHEA